MSEIYETTYLNQLEFTAANYEKVVKQNQQLQQQIKKMKLKPFFPFPANSGNRKDYGKFYLISHAWFTFLNDSVTVGIIEVEYKSPKPYRKVYLGIGRGDNFDRDVLNIARYGQLLGFG